MQRVVAAVVLTVSACLGMGQPAQFTGIQALTNKEILLQLTAPAGLTYRIEAATNIVDWTSLLTLTSTGVNRHADSATPWLQSRLYRALELTGTNNATGDHLATTNGDVIIHPMFHATLMMVWNDVVIYNDPDDSTSFPTAYNGLPKANIVLVGHHHGDHLSATRIESIRGTNTVIIAPPTVYSDPSMTPALRAITTVLTNGMSTNLMGLLVEAVPAYNTNSTNHPRGRDNGYVVTMGGRRIYMPGDTSNIPEMRALQNIDVAFMPMNLPFTMAVSDAVNAVRAFRPKIVYPYHYSGTSLADVNLFKRLVSADPGIEVRLRRLYP
jgi:L-ascorbate metabolism protein UlaG (beta-lactamase superfamily)